MVQRKQKKPTVPDKKNGQKQLSLLSFFSPKTSEVNTSNPTTIKPVETDLTNTAKISQNETSTVSTPRNITEDVDGTKTSDPQQAYDKLLQQLENSSDESIIGETPHRKKSFRRLSLPDHKRLRLSRSPDELLMEFQQKELSNQNKQFCKRVKLSQSPKKSGGDKISEKRQDVEASSSAVQSGSIDCSLNAMKHRADTVERVAISQQKAADCTIQNATDAKRTADMARKTDDDREKARLELGEVLQSSDEFSEQSGRKEFFSQDQLILCNQVTLSPVFEKENKYGDDVLSKSLSISPRNKLRNCDNVLQELQISPNNSLCTFETTKKRLSNELGDIENLGDLFNEEWSGFTADEYLDLSEWKYCIVSNVEETNLGLKIDLQEHGKKICNPLSTSCIVQGYWGDKRLQYKDVISIKAYRDHEQNLWRVDHTQGYIVKHPDILMSSTTLVSSLFCQRRAVLNYLYPGIDSKNISMLLGSLIHELLQEVLMKKLYSEQEIKTMAVKLTNKLRIVLQSYEYGVSSSTLEKELQRVVPEIINFINIYILETEENKMWPGKIKDIMTTEENFWIPQLGFKGKTDFIMNTEMDGKTRVMPLELKTGRASNSIEHRGQIILYLMMMFEVGISTDAGLLLYLKHNIIKEINPCLAERQGVVTTRNNLVDYYVANDKVSMSEEKLFIPSLPEPINHHTGCAKCPYLTICSALLNEEPQLKLADNNPLKELSKSVLAHLSPNHIHYVFRWSGLLKMDEMEKQKETTVKVSHIWRLSPEDRRKHGYCIDKLRLKNVRNEEYKFIHYMQRESEDTYELTKSGLIENDYVVVSTESRLAIVCGYVHSISEKSICLKFDHALDAASNVLYIVDKYSISNTLLAFNISSLFSLLDNTEISARMRRLIIDMEVPLFNSFQDIRSAQARSILSKLNRFQKDAVLRTLAAEDYLLIKGLPGTGKTATITALVRLLVQLNNTVLITSHTHSAVDNILLRLKGHVNFLRLGYSGKVHKDIQPYSEDFKIKEGNLHTVEQIELLYNQEPVIAVTCMGCSHSLLNKRTFDYCIVDEATQILQPSVLKSLFSARKFVLVGDPKQLPPVVQSRDAGRLGFDESLFIKLDRPEVTSTLYIQYRMNSKIMELANLFSYDNQLQCDNEAILSSTIQIKHSSKNTHQYQWFDRVLSSHIADSIIFLNTSKLLMNQGSSEYANRVEANITFSIVESLLEDVADIGIIAPYREQVNLLKKMSIAKKCPHIEINTVDQYQGRDKDVIIYSCTKHSNAKEGGILADKRRLTVAITRAKKKLIIIGNVVVLKKYSVFEKMISFIPQNNFIDIFTL